MIKPRHWRQSNVTFAARRDAEQLAVRRIGPVFDDAEDRGLISSWFFIRKAQWRFRWLPASPAAASRVRRALTAADSTATWTSSVCEFETVAFGGPAGLTVARALFHADSRNLLHWLAASPPLGRPETSVLLCSALMRGADLDWFEQGDVWARVRDLRPHGNPPAASTGHADKLRDAMRTLMTADARALCDPATNGAFSGRESWITAFESAGQDLARMNQQGQLGRGPRAVLAHHLIFHFNRAGINSANQVTMTALAIDVVFNSPGPDHGPLPER